MNDSRDPTYDKPRNMAIALHYSGKGAPRITAKGGGYIAQHIIDTAKRHNVPLEEDAALVGALSKVELGREIPRELWIAVAQVLAFAWTISGKKKV
jgi:flagellar biosynthesis protein